MNEQKSPAPNPKKPAYISNQKLTQWLAIFLMLNIVTSLLMLISYYVQYDYLHALSGNLSFQALREMQSNLWLVIPPSLHTLVGLTILILFLVWIYRACHNLLAFEIRGLRYSPGWALGWWFIPIFNFFRPYQVMKEIYLASDSLPESASPSDWKNGTRSVLFPWWWLFFIISWIDFNVKGNAISRELLITMVSVGAMACMGKIFAAVFFIPILKEINRRQEVKFQSIPAGFSEPGPQPGSNQNIVGKQGVIPIKKKMKPWVVWLIIGSVVLLFSCCGGMLFFTNHFLSQKYSQMEKVLQEDLGHFLTYTSDKKIILKQGVIGCPDYGDIIKVKPFLDAKDKGSLDLLVQNKKCFELDKGSAYEFINLNEFGSVFTLLISNRESNYYVIIPKGNSGGKVLISD